MSSNRTEADCPHGRLALLEFRHAFDEQEIRELRAALAAARKLLLAWLCYVELCEAGKDALDSKLLTPAEAGAVMRMELRKIVSLTEELLRDPRTCAPGERPLPGDLPPG